MARLLATAALLILALPYRTEGERVCVSQRWPWVQQHTDNNNNTNKLVRCYYL